MRRYQERIYSTIYQITANHEDANDLAQDTFIKAFQALPSFQGQSSFFTWIYRIAVNRTLNFKKAKRNRNHFSINDVDARIEQDPEWVAFISDNTPVRNASLTELQEFLNKALMKLSDVHRTVVILHDVQGLSHEEIAQIMDCSNGTVRSRLHYARQQLQAHLSAYLQ